MNDDRLRRRARQYIDSDQWVAAQTTLESLLQRAPGDTRARLDLADVLLRRGRMQAATDELLLAMRSIPDQVEPLLPLAQSLCRTGEIAAARTCLDRLAQRADSDAPSLAMQAQLRWTLGEVDTAKALIKRAIAAGADSPDERYLQAMLHQYSGDIDGAAKMLDACLQRWPSFGGAAMARANLHRQTADTHHLNALHEQLQRIPHDSMAPGDRLVRAEFESACFKELDDLGRHDEAWEALERSNALMHALYPYDMAGETAIAAALIRAADTMGETGAFAEIDGPMPIFIVGMPRSGTTLLDRMLSNHSQVTSAGEINDFLRQLHWVADIVPNGPPAMLRAIERASHIDFAELGRRYLEQARWRAQGRRYFIDKLPANVQMVPFIRRALPHAPILHMVREPMATCFSNLRSMFGGFSPSSYDMQALAHYFRQYRRLVGHWHASHPGAMLDVSYEALIDDPKATLTRVLAHCGLDHEDSCLHPERNAAPVSTPSNMQVREAIHRRGLEHWQRYRQHLTPLSEALGETVTATKA